MASLDKKVSCETPGKADSDYVEEKDIGVKGDPTRYLSEQHKAYLLERHGRCDLDPIPSMDPTDPYNWPLWKVSIRALIMMKQILTNTRKQPI